MNNKILIIANDCTTILQFRSELVTALIKSGFSVLIALPFSDRNDEIINLGCELINLNIERRGKNPFKDFMIIKNIKKIINVCRPDIVLTFTIKPNIYGGIACAKKRVPYISNVTGLGDSIMNRSVTRLVSLFLYRLGLKKSNHVFFQNQFNCDFMKNNKILKGNYSILPGSGVNLVKNFFEPYPQDNNIINFSYIGRMIKDKGFEELIESIEIINKEKNNVHFTLVGEIDDLYKAKVDGFIEKGWVTYLSYQKNIHQYIKSSNAIILPSYHEGMSNVLLESASCGRPVLASNIPGCKEIVDEGITGFLFDSKSVSSIVNSMKKFISLSYQEKINMGLNARKKMENEFDRNIVVDSYISKIKNVLKGE